MTNHLIFLDISLDLENNPSSPSARTITHIIYKIAPTNRNFSSPPYEYTYTTHRELGQPLRQAAVRLGCPGLLRSRVHVYPNRPEARVRTLPQHFVDVEELDRAWPRDGLWLREMSGHASDSKHVSYTSGHPVNSSSSQGKNCYSGIESKKGRAAL
jgi:hypothetical protein